MCTRRQSLGDTTPESRSDPRATVRSSSLRKIIARRSIVLLSGARATRKRGCRVAAASGGLSHGNLVSRGPGDSRARADLDRLGDQIAELSAHLDAATARLLDLIREFDARDGWNTGFRSCAAWLSWRVGLDPGAARERVRVTRALGTLPRLAHALARGELSYEKVRALTRVATPETEERLLKVGRARTAGEGGSIVRGGGRGGRGG